METTELDIENFHIWRDFIENKVNFVLSELNPKSVLDVGFGETYHFLNKKYLDLTVIDNFDRSDDVKNARFIHSDINLYNIDFKYDLVICSEVLEHSKDPFKICSHLKTLSNNVLITCPSFIVWHPMYPVCGDYWRFMPDSLEVLFGEMKECGVCDPDSTKSKPLGVWGWYSQ